MGELSEGRRRARRGGAERDRRNYERVLGGEAAGNRQGSDHHRGRGGRRGAGAVIPDADRAVVWITARAEEMLDEMWAGEDRQCEEGHGEHGGFESPPERNGR